MKTLMIVVAALFMNLALAGEVRTRTLEGSWTDFSIATFSLRNVDGVEMLELLLTGDEMNGFSEDLNTEHIRLFYPTEILSQEDYAIMDSNRGRISFNPFNGKFAKTKRVAKRIFNVKTTRTQVGESRGWHLCSLDKEPTCQDGVYYSYGKQDVTVIEVELK